MRAMVRAFAVAMLVTTACSSPASGESRCTYIVRAYTQEGCRSADAGPVSRLFPGDPVSTPLSWIPPTQGERGGVGACAPGTEVFDLPASGPGALAGFDVLWRCDFAPLQPVPPANYPNSVTIANPAATGYTVEHTETAPDPDPNPVGRLRAPGSFTITWTPSVVEPMTISRVASVSWRSAAGGGGGASSSIDTTGATLLVVGVSGYAIGTQTVSDNKGNTWTALTRRVVSDRAEQLFYAENPTVGSGHTFTCGGVNPFFGAVAVAYSGTATASVLEEENGAAADQPGSVTPDQDGSLIVTSALANDSPSPSINQSFSIVASLATLGGQAYGVSLAELIQTTAAAVNPTWSGGAGSPTVIAVFKPASGGAEEGDFADQVDFDATFAGAVTRYGSLTAGAEFGEAWTARADAVAALESGIEAAATQSGQAAVMASIIAALEAGETAEALNLIPAAITAGVEGDDQYTALADATAAIQAGLEAGETWAGIVATQAGLLAGAELEAAFAGDIGLSAAVFTAGTEAAAQFAGAAAALGLMQAGVSAADAFDVGGATSAAVSAGASAGDVFAALAGKVALFTTGTEADAELTALAHQVGRITARADMGASFGGLAASLATITAGVVMGATFTAESSADPEPPMRRIVRSVREVRAVRVSGSPRVVRVH